MKHSSPSPHAEQKYETLANDGPTFRYGWYLSFPKRSEKIKDTSEIVKQNQTNIAFHNYSMIDNESLFEQYCFGNQCQI
jgi:hypothetical protein